MNCGISVNPDGVKAQMESGTIFGLTMALYGEITFEKGQVQQSNFHNYPMMRMNDSPAFIDVHILNSTEKIAALASLKYLPWHRPLQMPSTQQQVKDFVRCLYSA